MVRLVHTGDNHVGMKFNSRYPTEVAQQLYQERFDALRRIVLQANQYSANFLIVTGDLFDSINVSQKDIKMVTDILGEFNSDVIVIPGNHDFYEDQNSKLWSVFLNFSKSNIHFLKDYRPYEFTVSDQKVTFYPAGCRTKYSDNNLIGWITEYSKESKSLNIGLAHGNVDGLGIDYEDKYFNMVPNELKEANLDCWLLGHIHVPYPSLSNIGNADFFFCGTHTPDGFDYLKEGCCWLIDFEEKKIVNVEQWTTGAIRFFDKAYIVNNELDIEKVEKELNQITKKSSLIRLNFQGRLTELEKARLNEVAKGNEREFLFLYYIDEIIIKLQKEQIDSLYTNNSLPHKLLLELSKTDKNDLALQLAHQLIEEVKQ